MGSLDEGTWSGSLILSFWVLVWVAAMLGVAVLAPSFAVALLCLALVNLLALRLAWRFRAIPGGQDTEWSDARPMARPITPPHPPGPRRHHQPLPPTRPLHLGDPPPQSGDDGAIATVRQTYIYDN